MGRRIVHISDLHNALFGPGQADLLAAISNVRPDLIVTTGDMIDARNTDPDVTLMFLRGALEVAPVCAVAGNHESCLGIYKDFRAASEEAGVLVLDDTGTRFRWGSCEILVAGLLDPGFFRNPRQTRQNIMDRICALREGQNADYAILLSHRPEYHDLYQESGFNLVLSGHAHGGQVRLPLIGGLFAPGQGIFPRYTAGAHRLGEVTMVVSRGVGPSRFPLRINNPPEVVVVTFAAEEEIVPYWYIDPFQ